MPKSTRDDGEITDAVFDGTEDRNLPKTLDPTVTMGLVQQYIEGERRRNRRALLWLSTSFLFVTLLVLTLFVAVGIYVLTNSKRAVESTENLKKNVDHALSQTAVYAAEIVGMTDRMSGVEKNTREIRTSIVSLDAERKQEEAEREKDEQQLHADLRRFSAWVTEEDTKARSRVESRLGSMERLIATKDAELAGLKDKYTMLLESVAMQKPASRDMPSAVPSAPPATETGSGAGQAPDSVDEPPVLVAAAPRPDNPPPKLGGEITVVRFPNGDRYEGGFYNGLFHGWGVYTYRNGDRYEGEFANDMKEGKGVFTYGNGDKYVGTFSCDQRHGRGSLTFVNGDKYVGQFRNGALTGKGTFVYVNGNRYTGDLRDGLKHGNGEFEFASGDTYKGEFENDQRHGRGTYLFSDGAKYAGDFVQGKRHGEGRYTYAAGQEYVGGFRNGRKHGQGTCVYPNGKEVKGLWEDGRLVSATSE